MNRPAIGTNLPNMSKTEDEPTFLYVFVSEKRMAAVGQRGAPEPRRQTERAH